MVCAGQLQILSQQSYKCKTLLEARTSESVNILNFLTKTKELAEKIKAVSEQLLKDCSTALIKEEEKQIGIGYPKSIEDAMMITRDPGERPKTLNTDQKVFLISGGPYQPKLMRYPRNEDIPKSKQSTFNPLWYDSSTSRIQRKNGQGLLFCLLSVSCWSRSGKERQCLDKWYSVMA